MLSDCKHPSFRNFNFTAPDDVVREKSYGNSLFNSTRVPMGVSVDKPNFVSERIMTGLVGVFTTGRNLSS